MAREFRVKTRYTYRRTNGGLSFIVYENGVEHLIHGNEESARNYCWKWNGYRDEVNEAKL